MKKLTRRDEISIYTSICGTIRLIEGDKQMLELIDEMIKKLDDPTVEELKLLAELKEDVTNALETSEMVLGRMINHYQGVTEGPVKPPEWLKKHEIKPKKEK